MESATPSALSPTSSWCTSPTAIILSSIAEHDRRALALCLAGAPGSIWLFKVSQYTAIFGIFARFLRCIFASHLPHSYCSLPPHCSRQTRFPPAVLARRNVADATGRSRTLGGERRETSGSPHVGDVMASPGGGGPPANPGGPIGANVWWRRCQSLGRDDGDDGGVDVHGGWRLSGGLGGESAAVPSGHVHGGRRRPSSSRALACRLA